jgi:hypothetical protein
MNLNPIPCLCTTQNPALHPLHPPISPVHLIIHCLTLTTPANFDDHDEADEETTAHLNKEVDDAEKNDEEPYGKPGSLLNRMIMHGNKKTEDQIASENAASGGGAQRTGP